MAASMENFSFSMPVLFFFVFLHVVSKHVQSRVDRYAPYATKTPYMLSFTKEELQLLTNVDSYAPDTCAPVHVSALLRHGTRFPSRKDIIAGLELAQKIRNRIINPSFADLNDWHIPFAPKDAKELAPPGAEELRHIGRRMGTRFRKLLHDAEPEEVMNYASSKTRAMSSAEHFQVGLGEALDRDMEQQIMIRDDILRFYDNCTHYQKSVEKNKEALKEYYNFREGADMQKLAEKISKKLGLSDESTMTTAEVKTAYTLSIFQEAIYGSSPWKDVFEFEDLELVEYTTDLKNYWRKGYGHSIAYEQSCPLFADIFQHLEESRDAYLDGLEWTKAVFRFAHAETVMPLLALIGLYKDKVPPTADSYPQTLRRQFRSSRISPFAANVAFILYHCDPLTAPSNPAPPGVQWPRNIDPFMVQLLVKELPVKFPFCKGHICSYDIVRKKYDRYISGCNFDEMCKLHHYQQQRDEL